MNNWRPHSERPAQVPQCCLLAASDEECGFFLLGDLYYWDGSYFRREDDDSAPGVEAFWWLPESEVLQGLPK